MTKVVKRFITAIFNHILNPFPVKCLDTWYLLVPSFCIPMIYNGHKFSMLHHQKVLFISQGSHGENAFEDDKFYGK